MTKQIKASLDEIVEAVSLQILIHNNSCINSNDLLNYPISMNLIRTALEKFVVEEEWISVEDRLPERNENVLILRDKPFRTYHVTAFQRDGVFISNETAKELIKVTHWMPLPTTPKKGGDDD